MYSLSDKAVAFMAENEDLLKLYRNPYSVTYEEYIATKDGREDLSYNDIIWGVLNRREMFSENRFCDKRRNAYDRARFLRAEGRSQEAMRYFVHTLFYDLNDPSRIIPKWAKKDWDGSVTQVQRDVLESIFELKEFYLPKMTAECYSSVDTSKILVKRKNFERMLDDIFGAKQIDAKNYLPKGCR